MRRRWDPTCAAYTRVRFGETGVMRKEGNLRRNENLRQPRQTKRVNALNQVGTSVRRPEICPIGKYRVVARVLVSVYRVLCGDMSVVSR